MTDKGFQSAYVVIITRTDDGGNTLIFDRVNLFGNKNDANSFLHDCYLDARLELDANSDEEKEADFLDGEQFYVAGDSGFVIRGHLFGQNEIK